MKMLPNDITAITRLATALRMKLKLGHPANSAVIRIAAQLSDTEIVEDYQEHEELKMEKFKARQIRRVGGVV